MDLYIMTQKEVLESMQGNISDDYEKKTAGYLTYDLLASASIELEKLYAVIEAMANKVDVDNLTGDELTKYVLQRRGIVRKEATYANVVLTVTGTGTVYTGDLFSTSSGLQFQATADTAISGTGTVSAECTTAGTTGVVSAGSITQMPVTLTGITAVTNASASYDGFEAEDDDSLRERYKEDLQEPATSNNIYHFKKWAKEISGVGGAKVIPTWNGNNSVKVLIIDEDMLPASADLVSEVQEYIDPIDASTWGKGYGEAALGSYCTVLAATEKSLTVSATVTMGSSYSSDDVKDNIETSITDYLQTIAFSDTINYVSYAKIMSLILLSEGVTDVADLTVNGLSENITLTDEEVAVLGTVTLA
jgi:uncharacterized phage protein gp47/JayE